VRAVRPTAFEICSCACISAACCCSTGTVSSYFFGLPIRGRVIITRTARSAARAVRGTGCGVGAPADSQLRAGHLAAVQVRQGLR
jgi:hypothetical protein